MSGIEVVGLVLGAIPLIISGLEHYGEGVRTIQKARRAHIEFRKLHRRMVLEQDIFRNSMELLLGDCVDAEVLQAIIDTHNSDIFLDSAIDRALRDKLRSSYGSYLATVRSMDDTLQDLQRRLRIGLDGKGPFNIDASSVKDAFRRLRFGLEMNTYEKLLAQFNMDNTALNELTKQSRALEPIRAVQRSRKLPDFRKMRSHASTIFGALQQSLYRSCKASHKASVYMKDVQEPEDGCDRGERETTCRVVLQHVSSAPDHTHSSAWSIEAEMRTLVGDVDVEQLALELKRAVHFQCPDTQSGLRQRKIQPKLVQAQQASSEEIWDLCSRLERLRSKECGSCLGYLVDSSLRRHGIYWPERPLVEQNPLSTVTLAKIFSDQSQGAQLSGADSRRLAVALTFGMLRLHDTPWLSKQWGHNEVTLIKKDDVILADHPFISADFQSSFPQVSSAANDNTYFVPGPLIRNETLFALGVLLIELCMAQPWEEMILPSERNSDGTKGMFTDFVAADRLLKKVREKAGHQYGNAVSCCIKCEYPQHHTSLENDAFRIAIYSDVYAALEKDMKWFLGIE